MEKKIIAVALVLVLIVTAFTACGKKYLMQEIDGIEYPVVTDKDGETIIDESNRVAFYVTEENGEIATNENKETVTSWIVFENDIATEDTLRGEFYSLKIPKDWEADSNAGRLEKKGANEMCCITPVMVVPEMEKGKSYADYIAGYEDVLNQAKDGLSKDGNTATLTKSSIVITEKNLACYKYVVDASDKDGKPIIHSENIFFLRGRTIYKMEYFSLTGVGYDKDFDFEAYLNENFTFVKE